VALVGIWGKAEHNVSTLVYAFWASDSGSHCTWATSVTPNLESDKECIGTPGTLVPIRARLGGPMSLHTAMSFREALTTEAQFPRRPLLGSLVNKGQPAPISKRDRSQKLATWPRMYQVAYLDYLVHRLPLLLTDMIGAKTKHRLVVEAKNSVSYRWVPET
jgi:hypothetical protein